MEFGGVQWLPIVPLVGYRFPGELAFVPPVGGPSQNRGLPQCLPAR